MKCTSSVCGMTYLASIKKTKEEQNGREKNYKKTTSAFGHMGE